MHAQSYAMMHFALPSASIKSLCVAKCTKNTGVISPDDVDGALWVVGKVGGYRFTLLFFVVVVRLFSSVVRQTDPLGKSATNKQIKA